MAVRWSRTTTSPDDTDGDFPTLVVRSPYGRGLPWSPQYGMLFAEQGFHVILQSCRGTGGSGGAFDLWRNEAADGQATVAWLRQQPWFNGTLGTIGPSYLGYVQWALALDPPPELKAMVVQVGLHDPYALFYADGALAAGAGPARRARHDVPAPGIMPVAKATLRLQRRMRDIVTARPLRGAYASALGDVPWLDDVMTHPDAGDPYWDGASLARAAEGLSVPTSLVSGWHDALADQTLEQYARLRAGRMRHRPAGRSLDSYLRHAAGLARGLRREPRLAAVVPVRRPSELRPTRVRVHVGGDGQWRDLDDWPSLPPVSTSWVPTPNGHLDQRVSRLPPRAGSAPLASVRYDPADPTPSIGGPLLSRTAGARDNARWRGERTSDFTGLAAGRGRGPPRAGHRAAERLHGHRPRRCVHPPVRRGSAGPLRQRL